MEYVACLVYVALATQFFPLFSHLQAVKYHYDHFAKRDTSLKVEFQRSEITLDIPEDGQLTRDRWLIIPMSYPSVSYNKREL